MPGPSALAMISLLILAAGAAALELKRLANRPHGAEETQALLEKEKHLTQVLQVIVRMLTDRRPSETPYQSIQGQVWWSMKDSSLAILQKLMPADYHSADTMSL